MLRSVTDFRSSDAMFRDVSLGSGQVRKVACRDPIENVYRVSNGGDCCPHVQVHPCGRYRHNTVVFILAKEYNLKNLRTIHRLDRLTSGKLPSFPVLKSYALFICLPVLSTPSPVDGMTIEVEPHTCPASFMYIFYHKVQNITC